MLFLVAIVLFDTVMHQHFDHYGILEVKVFCGIGQRSCFSCLSTFSKDFSSELTGPTRLDFICSLQAESESESELFTGDTSKDNHSPGPVFREVSP